ncbi:hypothetical protein BV22DRAFT_1028180 [Leucogyrophana mollusca]|uniref:Uncharacterized protein n=1 Tax=Leucogyrophana mollusca TaxID=85980 RepID=A0ACB8C1G6_9AGAM|nr:hypothetical protein BV22DRAFT_1028180 [Leucogyrophana mollusca]
MRGLVSITLALAGLAAAHASSSNLPLRRKSLSFGPVHSHAYFASTARDVPAFTASAAVDADPYDVARAFLAAQYDPSSYAIREDSYTDAATGVTHVYVRQLVNGIEVQDGDINLNIKHGAILSHGNSFYPGPPPAFAGNAEDAPHPHAEYCAQLDAARRTSFLDSHQTPLASPSHAELHHLHTSNCAHVHLPYSAPSSQSSPERALLAFLSAALPEPLAHEEVDALLAGMSSVFESSAVGPHHVPLQLISGAPGAVSDVKAKMAYVQVPDGHGGVALELVHRFEVEMQDNWYEATVSARAPHRIVSVVDWASDSPMPLWSGDVDSLPPLPVDLTMAAAPVNVAPIPPKVPALPALTPATYNVFPWGTNDPVEAAEKADKASPADVHPVSYGRALTPELADTVASPAGWHALPFTHDPQSSALERARARVGGEFWRATNTTWGNNVFAHENWEGRNEWMYNGRPEGAFAETLNKHSILYDYEYAPAKGASSDESMAEAKKHVDATVTQLFYTSNMVHDLFYRYGFDEASGNFQQYNFGRGGAEGDAVIANAQDGSGFNNANFMTPPDGQNGRCRMYLWNTANPYRDGDMEAGIVIHELAHGLSTRLTGGPKNSGCLGWGESGGMGEGWGDFLATTIRSTGVYSDYAMGAWAANRDTGIRNYVYSTDKAVNPSTYKTLDKPGYWGVHAIGEVWAEILWVVSQRLIAKHGHAPSLFPPASDSPSFLSSPDSFYVQSPKTGLLVPRGGNALMVQLVLNGMKLQRCSPSFFDARDAIVQADEVLTGGENACELWKGFAERGLGVDATVEGRTPWGGGIRKDGYKVPVACGGAPDEDPEEDCGPLGCW